ncbi:MAG: hypothetical protein L0H93_02535 [Nocardioides sp.]|nr:hypothetical protein [Nocardioides sp.]
MFTNSDIISTYTRADALNDCTLIDTGPLAAEAGFKFPMALTRAAWEDCVAWTIHDGDATGHLQDETGRLWDVLTMARHGIRQTGPGQSVTSFPVNRITRNAHAHSDPTQQWLILEIHGGDHGEPVMTVMLPGED